jgi:hypothetical protein
MRLFRRFLRGVVSRARFIALEKQAQDGRSIIAEGKGVADQAPAIFRLEAVLCSAHLRPADRDERGTSPERTDAS